MEEKKLTVTFVNVGYGEAILLESPDPSKPDGVFTALIDGGSAEDSEFADRSSGRVRIEEYLKKRGIRRLDLAVSTHIHEDHLCGLLRAAGSPPRRCCGKRCRRIFTDPSGLWTAPWRETSLKANSCRP